MATKKCPKDKEISAISGNCVKKCKPGQYRSKETGRCRKKSTTRTSKSKKPKVSKKCPKGKEISSISGNCVKKCKPNQVRNKSTGRCVKIKPNKNSERKYNTIPHGKYITKSGELETRVNVGRSVEFETSKDICAKSNRKICQIVKKYNLLPTDYFISKK